MPKSPVSRHFAQPANPASEACKTAHVILCRACDSCESFHSAFRQSRSGRGTTTDAEQDGLRAMLVFACAGLDACLKQLVRDALPLVIDRDKGAHENFTESVKRRLPDIERSRDLLANVLTAKNPRKTLVAIVANDLVSDSLQSVGQMAKIAAAFNVRSNEIGAMADLRQAFEARNQIIHEMDINFSTNRSRRPRKRSDMERFTRVILAAAGRLLKHVDGKLTASGTKD